jgi:short-subunit dehydrogenase
MAIPSPRPGSAALITGASSGIGLELARLLCARGHDAVLVARRHERLEALADELRSRHARRVDVIACDVSEPSGRDRLRDQVQELGLTVDVLVLCAGFGMGGQFIAQDHDRVRLMVRTNFEAVVDLAGAFAPAMASRGRGAILIVSSMAGNQPMPNLGVYAASKAAVTSFAEMLHAELRPSGVTVTALCPGAVATEFSSVADMAHAERRLPGPLLATAGDCAHAGIEALAHGRRVVVPGRAVRVLNFFGAHAPRPVWLRVCRRLLA